METTGKNMPSVLKSLKKPATLTPFTENEIIYEPPKKNFSSWEKNLEKHDQSKQIKATKFCDHVKVPSLRRHNVCLQTIIYNP